jgi:preprotein translocase subunit SecG
LQATHLSVKAAPNHIGFIMQSVLLIVHLIIALLLIGTILLQRSEGGALGIGGSGGGGGSLFSARGVGNGLTRATALLAVGFFFTSVALTVLSTHSGGPAKSVLPAQTTGQQAPAAGDVKLPNLGQKAPDPSQVPTNN